MASRSEPALMHLHMSRTIYKSTPLDIGLTLLALSMPPAARSLSTGKCSVSNFTCTFISTRKCY